MSAKRKLVLKYAAAKAVLHMMADEESSSSSDDEIELLLFKAYCKYKSKRRKTGRKMYYNSNSTDSSDTSDDDANDSRQMIKDRSTFLPSSWEVSASSEYLNDDSEAEPTNMLDIQLDEVDSEEWLPAQDDVSDSDDTESVENITTTSSKQRLITKQTPNSSVTHGLAKLDDFIPDSVSTNWTNSADFKCAFTISRSAAEALLRNIPVNSIRGAGRPAVVYEKGLLITLWILATKESFYNVSIRFGNIGKSTTYRTFLMICRLMQKDKQYRITWPTGSQADKVVQDFQFSIPGVSDAFPGAFGCLGATHIRIGEHKDKYKGYYNRLNYPSIIVQAVCDSSGRFTDVSPGHIGSFSDATVWRSSSLQKKLKTNPELLPPDTHLIGHEAYPLATNLMVPYKPTVCLSADKLQYNFILNNRRSLIDKVFSKLKQQWPRLQYLENRNLDDRCKDIITAACICYNISLDDGEVIDYGDEEYEDSGCVVGQYEDEIDAQFDIEEEAIIKRDNVAMLCQS